MFKPRGRSASQAVMAGCLLALPALLLWGCTYFGSAPVQVYCPRYASDGRGIYYLMEYSVGPDSYEEQLYFRSSIDASPVSVSTDTAGVPGILTGDENGAGTRLGRSPDGRFYTRFNGELSRNDRPVLQMVNATSGESRVVCSWPSGMLDAAEWLDDKTILAGVSMQRDDSCSLELVDLTTGRSKTVLRIPATATGPYREPAALSRIVVDPEGFAVFRVDADGLVDEAPVSTRRSGLYIYSCADGSVKVIPGTREYDLWDYSEQRNMLLVPKPSDETQLIEVQLPGM